MGLPQRMILKLTPCWQDAVYKKKKKKKKLFPFCSFPPQRQFILPILWLVHLLCHFHETSENNISLVLLRAKSPLFFSGLIQRRWV